MDRIRPDRCLAVAAVCLLVSLSPLTVLGQDSGLAFLQLGPDAASAAVGDANAATSGDAFATFWNPAGLSRRSTNDISLSHHIWVADVRTYALAGRFRSGETAAFGLFVTANTSGDIEARDAPGPPDGVFEAQYFDLGASYGRRLGAVRVGVSGKYISEEIFTDRASGYAFDFGTQIDFVSEALSIGAVVQNLGDMSKLNATPTKLPAIARIGIAARPFRVLALEDDFTVLDAQIVAELSRLFPDERTRLHAGIAVDVLDALVLRAGFVTNDALRNFTGGAGFRYEKLVFDYALVAFDSGFGGPGHILTLSYAW